MTVKRGSYFVLEIKEGAYEAEYNSESNKLLLKYNASKITNGHPLSSLLRNNIELNGSDIDKIIDILKQVKEQMNNEAER